MGIIKFLNGLDISKMHKKCIYTTYTKEQNKEDNYTGLGKGQLSYFGGGSTYYYILNGKKYFVGDANYSKNLIFTDDKIVSNDYILCGTYKDGKHFIGDLGEVSIFIDKRNIDFKLGFTLIRSYGLNKIILVPDIQNNNQCWGVFNDNGLTLNANYTPNYVKLDCTINEDNIIVKFITNR